LNILIVWHSGIVPNFFRRIQALAEINGNKVTYLAPHNYYDTGLWYSSNDITSKKVNIVQGRILFPGKLIWHFYVSGFLKVFYKKKYDIIEIFEEPYSICAFQITLLKIIFSNNSKILINSAQNIPINIKSIPFLVLSKIFKTSHSYAERSARDRLPFILNYINKLTLFLSSGLIVRSNCSKEYYVQRGYTKPIKLIGNGVQLSPSINNQIIISLNAKFKKQTFKIGFVGKVLKKKGIFDLVQACKKLSFDYVLIIVGNGPDLNGVLKSCIHENINYVHFDYVPNQDIFSYLSFFDVLVLPSITTNSWVEMFGRVLIEAMSVGTPVIGSDSGGIPQTISKCGLVYEESNIRELANCISTLFEDKELYNAYCHKGLMNASNYSWKNIANKINEYMDEVQHV
jgi:glycosyltransferase involved in cell wall biosynthesis